MDAGKKYYKGAGYWSVMSCGREDCPRVPHVWSGNYTIYGLYKCEDYPEPPVPRRLQIVRDIRHDN